MNVPKHDDNTGLTCWNSGTEWTPERAETLAGHPHCSLCYDLGEAWIELTLATEAHLARVARDQAAFQGEWRQGRPPRQKPGKQ